MLRTAVSLTCVVYSLHANAALAQVKLDRADPAIVERALPTDKKDKDQAVVTTPPVPQAPAPSSEWRSPTVSAIIVEGGDEIPRSAFSAAILPYIGRALSGNEVSELASAVAGAARSAGYPFASAGIDRQPLSGGVLRVQLDAGKLAAVRVIGAKSTQADAILSKALVTGRAVRAAELERAILLVGDLPGISVKDSKYVRQDGFGILLVTITEDPATAYVQIDNRGSKEVGPIRSTVLANVRGIAGSGDELGLLIASTPLQPDEFVFVRGRYSAPLGSSGSTMSVSASVGRAKPGAGLAALDVLGNSYDGAIAFSTPLERRRSRSLWGTAELRALRTKQDLLGIGLRDDRLVTLSGSLNGSADAAGGLLRAEATATAGLPFAWVTRDTDPMRSRSDGDARFATFSYTIDWTRSLSDTFSVLIGSQGQLASRPLLAAMELGAGGPAFGRGYDYAERTGDQGILGSLELRADFGSVLKKVIDRSQLYGFIDGGTVSNLRDGVGGGELLSSGAGIRAGGKIVDGMVEVALPLNAHRFDTGDRRPRISFRLSKIF